MSGGGVRGVRTRVMSSCGVGGSGMSGPRGMFSCSVGGGSVISGPRWMFSCVDGGLSGPRGVFSCSGESW